MKYPHFKNILVPGPPGLKAEFKRQGFNVDVNTFDRTKTSFSIDDFDKMDTGESDPKTKIDAVIASTDTDFNFYRECFMSLAVQRGAKLISTHGDNVWKTKNGSLPGGGIIGKMLAMATKTELEIISKP